MAFGTVAEALERAGITLEGDDYTEPALDQLVAAGTKIRNPCRSWSSSRWPCR